MKDAMREVLRHQMSANSDIVLVGEDIEDPKGDVFGVTKGLSTQYPGRVRNAPLSESTILGTSVGQALAGRRPVAFLQFADFLPLAYNQIATELGSMYWRTDGEWQAPVIVMIPCGAYRPGLGPFHSHSLESIAVHTPGIDVFMPSTAADAAGLLNAAFRSQRPTLFFYPKACLNDPEQTTPRDIENQFVPIGTAQKSVPGAISHLFAGAIRCVYAARRLTPWSKRALMRRYSISGACHRGMNARCWHRPNTRRIWLSCMRTITRVEWARRWSQQWPKRRAFRLRCVA